MQITEEQVVRQLLGQRAKLLAYIWAIVRDSALADDVYQEVALEAITRREELREPEALPVWLRRTARFKALAVLRDRHREYSHLNNFVLDQLDEVWDRKANDRTQPYMAALSHCLGKLSPRSRRMVALRYTEGEKGAAVAETLGIKLNSLYIAMSRIHQQLRVCINSKLNEEGVRD